MRYMEQLNKLDAAGWDVLTIWECEMRDAFVATARLTTFLDEFRPEQLGGVASDAKPTER